MLGLILAAVIAATPVNCEKGIYTIDVPAVVSSRPSVFISYSLSNSLLPNHQKAFKGDDVPLDVGETAIRMGKEQCFLSVSSAVLNNRLRIKLRHSHKKYEQYYPFVGYFNVKIDKQEWKYDLVANNSYPDTSRKIDWKKQVSEDRWAVYECSVDGAFMLSLSPTEYNGTISFYANVPIRPFCKYKLSFWYLFKEDSKFPMVVKYDAVDGYVSTYDGEPNLTVKPLDERWHRVIIPIQADDSDELSFTIKLKDLDNADRSWFSDIIIRDIELIDFSWNKKGAF